MNGLIPADDTRTEVRSESGSLSPAHDASRFIPSLVVIAASADGFEAIGGVLSGLPRTFSVPVAVVLHRSIGSTRTAQLLQRRSELPVMLAEQGMVLEPGKVYIAPPDRHLVVRPNRSLHLMDGTKIRFQKSSANPLFDSAAYALEGNVVAVVLSGGGADGTDGVQTVKAMGGVVIAQKPAEARFSSMPESAIGTGSVDYVLPLDGIAPKLIELASSLERPTARRF